jgi:membrane-associated phospholipid phosphatase
VTTLRQPVDESSVPEPSAAADVGTTDDQHATRAAGYGWRDGGRLLLWMLALTAFMLALGFVITRAPFTEGLRAWDDAVANDWVSWRTPLMDTLTHYGSTLSDTPVAILATVVAVLGLRWASGAWTLSVVVVAAIGGELLYFLVLTSVVGRERPDVPKLDAAPPTSSYPSGHTGAAVALYGCLAVLLLRYAADRALAVPLAVVLLAVPVVVGLSRMYRGMHFATDVMAGALGGLLWLVVVLAVLLPRTKTST